MLTLTKVALYLHPEQKAGSRIKGFDLEQHLKETSLINRCLSFEDAQPWIRHPEDYPEEFKDGAVFLWKTAGDRLGDRIVCYLCWREVRVAVYDLSIISGTWSRCDPAALSS